MKPFILILSLALFAFITQPVMAQPVPTPTSTSTQPTPNIPNECPAKEKVKKGKHNKTCNKTAPNGKNNYKDGSKSKSKGKSTYNKNTCKKGEHPKDAKSTKISVWEEESNQEKHSNRRGKGHHKHKGNGHPTTHGS